MLSLCGEFGRASPQPSARRIRNSGGRLVEEDADPINT
jgi:hypothetical protein